MVSDKIAVVDFGGQYAHLLARRVRELGVFSEILQPNASKKDYSDFKGVILSGSPYSICDLHVLKWKNDLFKMNIPVLGICYGHQLIMRENGGEIRRAPSTEFGSAKMHVLNKKGVFKGLKGKSVVWMSHNDEVSSLAPGFEVIGKTADCKYAAIANFEKKWFGFQFHPEVTHSEEGQKMLKNFVFNVCQCKKEWSLKDFKKQKIREIRKKVGKKNVFLLASGGIDSTVCLALLLKSLPKKQIHAFFIDTGLMRQNEPKLIQKSFEKMGFKLKIVKAGEEFLSKLRNVSDPEQKRKIIGKIFLEVKDKELEKLKVNTKNWILAQGTIYPDTIESAGTKHADKIKTHHNRIEEILKELKKGKIIEPIEELYKDEVRFLGKELGLPKKFIERHPFPGPGLGVRILCSNGKQIQGKKLEQKINNFLKKTGYKAKILPVKSVGVQGDLRTYKKAVALEGKIDFQKIEKLSTQITNRFREINRVVLLLSPQKIKKLKMLKAFLTDDRIKMAREADAVSMNVVKKNSLLKKTWQFPTVLIPVQVNGFGESIVLRPIESLEAMTAKFYKMPKKALKENVKGILKIPRIGTVFMDVTHKPPATIEWE